jgi:hypothetical protein
VSRVCSLLLVAITALCAVGCAKGYAVETAPGFVKMAGDQQPYDWRAVAPEGVAVAVRVVKLDEAADLPFWTQTVSLRMREMDGYSLLSTSDVRSRDGVAGKELVFGHDEAGKPFLYRVRIFLAGNHLYVAEAGGAKEQMERYANSVNWMFASLKVS